MSTEEVDPDGRRRRTARSREAMASAAYELLLERGLDGVSVEEIADRAGVTRRTFSRHFSGKEEAVLGRVSEDAHRINDALRLRPAGEPPLTAYRNAVRDWLASEYGGASRTESQRRQELARRLELFRRFATEPALFAAYQRIRVEAEAESVRIIAEREGLDPVRDPRPAVAVGAGAGTLIAALRAWAAGEDADALPGLVAEFFGALAGLLPAAQAPTERQ